MDNELRFSVALKAESNLQGKECFVLGTKIENSINNANIRENALLTFRQKLANSPYRNTGSKLTRRIGWGQYRLFR